MVPGVFCEVLPICGESDFAFSVLAALAMFGGYYLLVRLIRFTARTVKRT